MAAASGRTATRLISSILIPPLLICCSEAPYADDPHAAETRTAESSDHIATDATAAWARVIEMQPDPAVVTDADVRKQIISTGLPWRVRHLTTEIDLVLIPAGEFVMGKSPGDRDANESELPSHRVQISRSFYISQTEVTQRQWSRIVQVNPSPAQKVAESKREARMLEILNSGLTREEATQMVGPPIIAAQVFPDFPVSGIGKSSEDLFDFLETTGLALPTEAQWEYACRAGSRSATYGDIDEIAWTDGTIHPVARLRPNAFGLFDMLGNALELSSDQYFEDAYSSRVDGVRDPVASPGKSKQRSGEKAFFDVPIVSRSFDQVQADKDEATRRGITYDQLQAIHRERWRRFSEFTDLNPAIRGGIDRKSARASWRTGALWRTAGSLGRGDQGPSTDVVGIRLSRDADSLRLDERSDTLWVKRPTTDF